MAGTASPWWDVWCQVAVMTLPLSAGCPGLGQSVLSGAESLQESVLKRKTGNLLQNPSMISQCLVPCQSETVLWDKLTLWNSLIFSGMHSSTAAARRSTNSPSAWGFSFLAIISLTTTKLACVTLSWSTRGSDKTACWPIHTHLSFQCIQFCMFHAIMTLKVCVFITAEASPQTGHTDLPFTFTKKNSFVYLSLKEQHSSPTFLFLLAISRFSQRESPLVVVTCQSLRTGHDDSYADVVFSDLGHGPERQTPAH